MLLLAAGRGTRFGGALPKAFLRLRGEALLVHSARRLLAAIDAGEQAQILLVVHPDDRKAHLAPCLEAIERAAGSHAVRIVDGGASRQDSMTNGLSVVDADADVVLVHDAARALVPTAAVRECIAEARRTGAALLAVPATDTQKRVADGRVAATLDRTGVWQAQTPQVVRTNLLRRAIHEARRAGFDGTDDVSLVERLGEPVAVVPGAVTNLKITHPGDLALAEAILAAGLA